MRMPLASIVRWVSSFIAVAHQRNKRRISGFSIILQIAISQQSLVKFAVIEPRQFPLEINAARTFDSRQSTLAPLHQFLSQLVTSIRPVSRLHNRFNLFSKLCVGDTEHSDISDPLVRYQNVFDFLGINIYTTRNNHEIAAVS